MTQQVNLYQPILRQQKRVFSSETIALIVAGVAAIMLLIWGFNVWQLDRLESRLADAIARESATAADVARVTREMSTQVVSVTLQNEVASLRAERALKEQLYKSVFADVDSRSRRLLSNGFVTALESLGRHRIDGLWMTKITFGESGQEATFIGRTDRAERVPQLVDELRNESMLGKLTFRTVRVHQDEQSRLRFELSTEEPKAPEVAK